MRVLVTGSRTWPSRSDVWNALDEILDVCCNPDDRPDPLTIVHGANWRGADRMASDWCRRHPDVAEERHPARWEAHKPPAGSTKTNPAGFLRNAEMVAAGADLCLAFIHNTSGGASHCAAMAFAAGIPTRRITRTGLAPAVVSATLTAPLPGGAT